MKWENLFYGLLLAPLFIVHSCSEKEENSVLVEVYIGNAFSFRAVAKSDSNQISYLDSTIFVNDIDTVTLTINSDSTWLKGRTINWGEANTGNTNFIETSRYISAAGGDLVNRYERIGDSLSYVYTFGNSFRSKYTFFGRKK